MKILFIWDGPQKFPEARIPNIDIAKKLYPAAEFYCITKLESFYGCTVISWELYKSRIVEEYGLDSSKLDVNWKYCTDYMRFLFLDENPDTLYLDTDLTLLKKYDFESCNDFLAPYADIYILYVPVGWSGGFQEELKKHTERTLYAFPATMGRKIIGREYFHHHF